MDTEPGFLELLLTDTNTKQRLLAYAYLSGGGGGGVGKGVPDNLQTTEDTEGSRLGDHLGSITCINKERMAKAFGT